VVFIGNDFLGCHRQLRTKRGVYPAEALFSRKDLNVYKVRRFCPSVLGPVGDIRAFNPLVPWFMSNYTLIVAVLGVVTAHQVSYNRSFRVTVIGGYRPRLQNDCADLEGIPF
jgi:hypothetical protein